MLHLLFSGFANVAEAASLNKSPRSVSHKSGGSDQKQKPASALRQNGFCSGLASICESPCKLVYKSAMC